MHSDARPKMTAPIRAAIAFIEQHYADPIPLSELASRSGLSLHRFVTVFRCQVGIPPHQYVCRTRVQQARTLLSQGVPPWRPPHWTPGSATKATCPATSSAISA